jgi:hypothetical protein
LIAGNLGECIVPELRGVSFQPDEVRLLAGFFRGSQFAQLGRRRRRGILPLPALRATLGLGRIVILRQGNSLLFKIAIAANLLAIRY